MPSAVSLLTQTETNRFRHLGFIITFAIIVLLLLVLGCIGTANAGHFPTVNESTKTHNSSQLINSSRPHINVNVNGKNLKNGSRIITGGSSRLAVWVRSTNLIKSVLVRIDGKTRYTYTPNSKNFSMMTSLELRNGGHRVTVIATGNTTAVHSVTIVEDTVAPRINFEEPFVTTGLQSPDHNYTVNTSNITLRGQLIDRTPVQRVIIKHRYEYMFNGFQIERSRYVIETPGDAFAQQLKLGPNRKNQTNGSNYITVEVVDEKGNSRVYSFVLNVSDTEPPNIEILKATPSYKRSSIKLYIHISDNVGISIFGRQLGSGNKTGLQLYYSENDIYNQPRKYTTTVDISAFVAKNGVILRATDLAGNVETVNYSFDYERFITPKITINTEATQVLGEATARIVGTIKKGRFSHVVIEARSSTGALSDILVLQSEQTSTLLEFNESVRVDSYPVTVRVRVRDITGTEHVVDYQITRPKPRQTPQPTQSMPTKTAPQQPTATENEDTTSTGTATLQQITTEQGGTETPTTSRATSRIGSIIRYLMSLLPYTLASALCTVILYIIARKFITY